MTLARAPRSVALTAILAAGLVVTTEAEGPSPTQSLSRLKAGNTTFVANASEPLPIDGAKRSALAGGEHPFASILSCADSRVPPEVIFHTGLGDLFVVRAAGQITDRAVLASLEYSTQQLHVPLLVVMGHESCDAVKSAIETPEGQSLGPNLDYLLKQIRPAVNRTGSQVADAVHLRAAILENVEEQINDLLQGSAMLKHMAETNEIALVGAYYELATGSVHFSEIVKVAPATRVTASHH